MEFPDPYGIGRILLISPRLEFTPTNTLFINGFLQYNTQAGNVNFNARVQWRYAPMSDVFLVYTENYGTEKWNIRDRGVVLKCVYRFEPNFSASGKKRKAKA